MMVLIGGPLQKNCTSSLGSRPATRREMGPDTFFFSEPFRSSASRQRAALLNQIGLSAVAEWDLRSIQAPVR
jgi:hypothetical protein